MKYKILIVDDDDDICEMMKRVLINEEYQATTANTGGEALSLLDIFRPDLVLLDIYLDEMNGIDVLCEIKKRYPELLTIMITAHPDIETAVNAMKKGAYDFVQKPFMPAELVLTIKKALETLSLKKEVEALRDLHVKKFDSSNIIRKSAELEKLLQNVREFALTDVTILIEGESGTGKELVAQYIHHLSPLVSKPFVIVNCGAIPINLFESEFFGYEKGAFTGANTAGKSGLLEQAEHGTLFLDEINSMPLSLQVKLLRVLETGEYYRVGDPTIHKIKVRVIAACNADLKEEVKNRTFREDLYFRLNIKVKVPPLRDRRSDILPLANHFLDQANERYGKKVKGFSTDAKEVLLSLPFRGNVRQLRNLIDRVSILSRNEKITRDDLKLAGATEKGNYFHIRVDLNSDNKNGSVLQAATQQIVNKTLELANGNQTKAAKLLGIPRGTFRHHLKKR